MSGTFSRKMYDTESEDKSIDMSTATLGHIIDPVRNNRCYPQFIETPGFIGSIGVSTSCKDPQIDIETNLQHSRKYRYDDICHLPTIDFMTDYTRFSNPICTARGVGINRFQPLCSNPQDENRWLQEGIGINSRNMIKDNYKKCK